jgi:hypothetical protein
MKTVHAVLDPKRVDQALAMVLDSSAQAQGSLGDDLDKEKAAQSNEVEAELAGMIKKYAAKGYFAGSYMDIPARFLNAVSGVARSEAPISRLRAEIGLPPEGAN